MKEERNIDELFRSSFEDFEIAPPASVKKTIDSRIGGESSSRKGWWFSVLILLIGAGVFAAFYFGRSEAPQHQVAGAMASNTPSASNHVRSSANNTHTASAHSAGKSGSTTAAHPASSNGQSTTAGQKTGNDHSTSSSGKLTASGKLYSGKGTIQAADNTPGKKATIGGKTGKQQTTGKGPKSGSTAAGGGPTDTGTGYASSDGSGNGGSGGPTGGAITDPVKPASPVVPDPEQLKKDSVLALQKEQHLPAGKAGKKDSIARIDDSSYEENTPAPAKPGNKPEDLPLWMASVYAGPQFGFNRMSSEQSKTFTEKPAFQFSGEINRSLFAGYGLSTGLNYSTKREESLEFTTTEINTYTTFDSIPIWNQNQDSIIGYDVIIVDHSDTIESVYRQVNTVSAFGFPVYLNKQFRFGDRWGMLVNAGAQFNFYKITLGAAGDTTSPPQTNDFSVNIVGRVHATYRWNNWLFSAGVAGGYDLKPAIIYQERKRYYLTPQVGVHWTF
jgi:hypothetical protein